MAHGEIHLELSVNYADDEKLRQLAAHGRRARTSRDLYVQMLCYCKRNMTDGSVPVEQIGLLVYPDTLKDGMRDVEVLTSVGLLERPNTKTVYVPGFLKRNKSKQQIADEAVAKRESGVLANHKRWHKDGKTDPKCIHCRIGTPIGVPTGSTTRSESTETETETETERPASPAAPPRLDVEQVCAALAEAVERNGSRRPTITEKWRTDARLMLDRDRRSLADVLAVIDWSADHTFWRTNILSVPKLREQFDKLRLQREADPRVRTDLSADGFVRTGTDPHDEWGFD